MPSDEAECVLREMQCELNVLSRSDGSAILSQGNTTVVVSVYGPIECKIQNSNILGAVVEVYFSKKSGLSSVQDRYRETMIKQICETASVLSLYPRDSVSINVQEMQDSGGLIATCLNTCCLALINSGIAMRFLFAAVCCVIKESGEILIDPISQDLIDAPAVMTFVFDSVNKDVIASITDGSFSPSKYHECISKCRKASENIFSYYRDIVKKYAVAL